MPQNYISSSKTVVFAILLPIICREEDDDTLGHLSRFAKSLVRTSQSQLQKNEGARFRLVVYLDVYHVDDFVAHPSCKMVEDALFQEGLEVVTVTHDQHLGSSLSWSECAKKAFDDGCHFMALMRHDTELRDEGWMEAAHANFGKLGASSGMPFGFGCVALRDINGLPTLPIVHRIHMEIFQGIILPDICLDMGAEFLFQLYRRFGGSTILSCQVSNVDEDRNLKSDWTFEILDAATVAVEAWLQEKGCKFERFLTLDIVVPTHRVMTSFLRRIIELKPSKSCSVMYIIIIDNPDSPQIFELKALCSNRSDVRIRANKVNLGAPATRNRGIDESAAEWIHFLDDDIVPGSDLIMNVERHLRAHPNAAGCAGVTDFPPADSIWEAAVLVSGTLHYFSVAKRLPSDVPWSVGANLVARRNIRDGVRFKSIYPKTGGGEDIDFCLSKRAASKARGGEGFSPAPDVRATHRWWPEGRGAYWRFYAWSHADHYLTREFPQHIYLDFIPNSAESLIICLLGGSIATITACWSITTLTLKVAFCVVLSNALHDCYRHLFLHPERIRNLNTSVHGVRWFLAVVESSFIRLFREIGWFHGMIEHGEFNFFRRFDINAGRLGFTVIKEERKIRLQKIVLSVLCTLVLLYC